MSRTSLSERSDADLLELIAVESSRDAMRVLYDRHVSWLSARLRNRCAGIDPEQRLRFRELASRLAADRVVVLSTHLTEDIEALCDHVIVLDEGQVRFDGTPQGLARVAEGRVWRSDQPSEPGAVSWRMGDGSHRHIGTPRAEADLLTPTVEDGYLLLLDKRTQRAA